MACAPELPVGDGRLQMLPRWRAGLAAASVEADIAGAVRSQTRVLVTAATVEEAAAIGRLIHEHGRAGSATLTVLDLASPAAHAHEGPGPQARRAILAVPSGATVLLRGLETASASVQDLLWRSTSVLAPVHADDVAGRLAGCRLITVSAGDLHADVGAGRLREDLFYRLNVIHVRVPTPRVDADEPAHTLSPIPEAAPCC
ncbi:MAG: sigma 54-interacting transcriptional regulator [Vicinamibacterales bacterium]